MLCALSINKRNSLNKPECPFVLYLCLILTVLWKSYIFTILKYLLLFPWGKFNCILFIALGINTHSLLRNFLQGLLNMRRGERMPWCVEGGYSKVQPCIVGNKTGPPDSRGCINSRAPRIPSRQAFPSLPVFVLLTPRVRWGLRAVSFLAFGLLEASGHLGAEVRLQGWGSPATPLPCSEGTVLEGGPGRCSSLGVGPHGGQLHTHHSAQLLS